MDGELFGTTAEDEPVHRYTISGGGLTASVMNWGAVVQDLRLAGHDAPLVLGFDRFEDYLAHPSYFGAIAGRYANRIRGGRFTIAGRALPDRPNFIGKHMLHGGSRRLRQARLDRSRVAWRGLRHADAAFARRRHGIPRHARGDLYLPAEDPGHAVGGADRDLRSPDAVQSRAPLLLQPRRWRRRGRSSITGYAMAAAAYLPVDDELIPTGVVQPVDGTAFDFAGAADPPGDRRRAGRLRPQFLPRFRARAAAAGGLGAGRIVGRRDGSVDDRTRRAVLYGAVSRARHARAGWHRLPPAFGLLPGAAGLAGSRRTGRISRRRAAGRARSTGRRPSTGSASRRRSAEGLFQRLERRQRAAHLDDCRGDAVGAACRVGRRGRRPAARRDSRR